MLSDVEQAQLWQALQSPPPDGELWNGRKVAESISGLTCFHWWHRTAA